MDPKKSHWEKLYQSKRFDSVSWYSPHLEESLHLIEALAPGKSASIIDVGGGESTLVDDLLALGYRRPTVLDISQAAIDFTRERLGASAALVDWLVGDVTSVVLPVHGYDVWHDRAVFHFLTSKEARTAYVEQVRRAVKPGGFVIMATFGPQGPTQCSGLDVVRYEPGELHGEFGDQFRLLGAETVDHQTPSHSTQQFLYCWCRLAGA